MNITKTQMLSPLYNKQANSGAKLNQPLTEGNDSFARVSFGDNQPFDLAKDMHNRINKKLDKIIDSMMVREGVFQENIATIQLFDKEREVAKISIDKKTGKIYIKTGKPLEFYFSMPNNKTKAALTDESENRPVNVYGEVLRALNNYTKAVITKKDDSTEEISGFNKEFFGN